ncbi:MAG TPA: molybdenum cofactor guanylyltransferase [Pyrinomonadaceae bacterium]|jgi:molybdopterin-guanine dinucleotide biosynthesis protein A|nr:molybdenum cofactor guanylyltransferase [Pyrinomonadaceae bacterium]
MLEDVEGFILVGGASSRMGADKARLFLGGQQFVARIALALGSITEHISVVGDKLLLATDGNWPRVPDVHPNWGALGGLHAALSSARATWAAIVACDLPFVNGELFVRLASLRQDYDAVVPVQADGRRQPLCALYRVTPCVEFAQQLIASGERRPRALLSQVRTRLVAHEELANLSGSQDFFSNINTPEDYARAQALERDKSKAEG